MGGSLGGSEAEKRFFFSGPHMTDSPVQECVRFRTVQVPLCFPIKIQNIILYSLLIYAE